MQEQGTGEPIYQSELVRQVVEYAQSGPPTTFHELLVRQDALNALCSRSTIDVGKEFKVGISNGQVELTEAVSETIVNYLMAIVSEAAELMDCVLWKHWSAEAKEGRRFYIHDPQNLKVELIDLLFFIISLLQSIGVHGDVIYSTLKKADRTRATRTLMSDVEAGQHVIRWAMRIMHAATSKAFPLGYRSVLPKSYIAGWVQLENAALDIAAAWVRLVGDLDFFQGEQDICSVYHAKYSVNVNRQFRGRRQVGDTLSDAENRSVE